MQACQSSINQKTILSSLKGYTDRYKEQLWEQEWILHMQIYL